MIDCLGVAPTAIPVDRDDRFISILHVQADQDGEPSLMCTRFADGSSGTPDPQPLIPGVENFQVLYGVDGIAPGNTTVPITATADSIPDRYLRADQLTVAGNTVATYANWRRVRSLRIGVVLRARPGSTVTTEADTYYPLGIAPASATGTTGSAFANSSADPGSVFSPGADGRLRQVITFTVHLRNFQEAETN